ncbi:RNA-binding protein 10 [Nymphon striatum]|nr:RNA-binding protein 10 [Nymphon striatum]
MMMLCSTSTASEPNDNVEETDVARSQEKEKEPEREREQERDRHKRRDRDRSSSRRRRRDRDRSRDRDRGRRSDEEYHDRDYDDDYGYNDDEYQEGFDDDRYSNWRACNRDRDRRHDRDDHRDDDRRNRYDRYERHDKEQPYHTIIIKYLPFDITEFEIRGAVVKHGLTPKDVRIVKNRRDTGSGSSSSRGFAFVEFDTVAEATHWMEVTQVTFACVVPYYKHLSTVNGVVDFEGGYHGIMFYSIPKDYNNDYRHGSSMQVKSDWNCANCGAHNFKRRDVCFKCSAEKKDSVLYGEGYEEMSSVPTSTLLFRNLDTLSTEDSVLTVVSNCATLPIKKIKIAKDSLTGISRGFCYVEMHSVNEAMQLYNLLSIPGHPLIIDMKEVSISYACTSATYMPREASAKFASAALAAAQWSNQASDNTMPTVDPTQFNYSQYYQQQQHYVAATTGGASYSASDYYQQDLSQTAVNTAAAVAQNALQQMQVAKEMQKKQQQIQETIIAKIQQKDNIINPEITLAQQAQRWTQIKSETGGDLSSSSAV